MNAYIVDTECTSREDDREVIELAWLRFQHEDDLAGESDRIDLHVVQDFKQRYQPSKPSGFGAIAVHHILPEELEGMPPSSEAALPNGCTYLIGHNCDFDWQALGSPDIKRICTYAMAQHVWPEADSYSQTALVYMLLGANAGTRELLKDAHSAINDCRNNLTLLAHILRAKPEIKTWSALYEFSEDCRIPLKMPITKARGELLTDIDDGLLSWCLNQHWMPTEHPYLYKGLEREYDRRAEYHQALIDKAQDKHDPYSVPADDDFDDHLPF